MKKIVAAAVVSVALAGSAMAATPYVSSFKAGKYTGTVTSVVPELNGKPATMELTQQGDKVTATVTVDGGKEVWTWNDTTLQQQEFDAKGTVVKQYGATAAKPATGDAQTYNINCADKAANKCDGNVDFRNTWTLKSNGANQVQYIVFGVAKDQKANPAATPQQRHHFTFTLAK